MKQFKFLAVALSVFILTLSSCGEDNCGDGIVNIDEQCDDGNDIETDDCTSFCEFSVCGDGIINQELEECDDANLVKGDGCDEDCKLEFIRGNNNIIDTSSSAMQCILETDHYICDSLNEGGIMD